VISVKSKKHVENTARVYSYMINERFMAHPWHMLELKGAQFFASGGGAPSPIMQHFATAPPPRQRPSKRTFFLHLFITIKLPEFIVRILEENLSSEGAGREQVSKTLHTLVRSLLVM
jgi:hypothetical protein